MDNRRLPSSRFWLLVRTVLLAAVSTMTVRPSPHRVVVARADKALAVVVAPTFDVMPTVTQAEGLLQMGRADAALRVLTTLDEDASRKTSVQRVRAYSLYAMGRIAELRDLLLSSELSGLESEYLAAVADGHQRGIAAANRLAKLWWAEPDSIWGLAALRTLVQIDRTSYGAKERDVVLRYVAEASPSSYLQDASIVLQTLAGQRQEVPSTSRLAMELEFALGVLALHTEHFTQAAAHLKTVLQTAGDVEFRRAVELHLGEALRRQNDYTEALRHFAAVAARGDDGLGAAARAAAGQMAIEQQRYREAQRLFREQLLDHPVGDARVSALFGLGWVAFRTGAYGEARQFLTALGAERPWGLLAPAAAYWAARAAEEMGDKSRSRAELQALVRRFPFDYYAYRARQRCGEALPADVDAQETPLSAEVLQLQEAVKAGSERRARALVTRLLAMASDLSPTDLDVMASIALQLGRDDQAITAARLRCRRFGARPGQACEDLQRLFPSATVQDLAALSEQAGVPTTWVVAAAYASSALRVDHIGDRGELGLLQLSGATLLKLAREESGRSNVSLEAARDSKTNSRLSVRYFARLTRAFNRRLEYALAALDAGPGAVTRWRETRGDLPGDIFVEEIPYSETREYVREALAALALYQHLVAAEPATSASGLSWAR